MLSVTRQDRPKLVVFLLDLFFLLALKLLAGKDGLNRYSLLKGIGVDDGGDFYIFNHVVAMTDEEYIAWLQSRLPSATESYSDFLAYDPDFEPVSFDLGGSDDDLDCQCPCPYCTAGEGFFDDDEGLVDFSNDPLECYIRSIEEAQEACDDLLGAFHEAAVSRAIVNWIRTGGPDRAMTEARGRDYEVGSYLGDADRVATKSPYLCPMSQSGCNTPRYCSDAGNCHLCRTFEDFFLP